MLIQVFDRFDRRGEGSIDYLRFLELIGFSATHTSSSSSASSSSEEVTLLVEKVRRSLEDYAGTGEQTPHIHTYIHTLPVSVKLKIHMGSSQKPLCYIHTILGSQSAGRIKAIFAEIDRDNSGTIDRDEFAKAMKVLRVDLTSREIQAVLQVELIVI